jgi:rSAM/selenodomain-associated transferase 2
VCRIVQSAAQTIQMCSISIVIPCYHDAAALERTLDGLQQLALIESTEVIVAASGDVDETVRACASGVRLLWPDGSTRAELMNAGAAVARGDILFFLHADSVPPLDALLRIREALSVPTVAGGAFEHRFAEQTYSLRLISWVNRRRYRITRNYYGDQGVFVRTDVFRRLGGYPNVRLMEDLMFAQRLKRAGKVALVPASIVTSGRRLLARGPWRTVGSIVWLLGLHTCRLDVQRYATWWRWPAGRQPGAPWRRARAASTRSSPDRCGSARARR